MEDGPPGFPRGFSCPVVLGWVSGASAFLGTGLLPPLAGLSRPLPLKQWFLTPWQYCYTTGYLPQPHLRNACRLDTQMVWAAPRSLAATWGISDLISFPRATEMFQFTRLPSYDYVFIVRSYSITCRELPHSGIPGSVPAYGSPGHFAVCRALLRLLAPRHPPYALSNLTSTLQKVSSRLCVIFKVQFPLGH